MATLRKPFLGVKNIVRFNWHFYLLAIAAVGAILLLTLFLSFPYNTLPFALALLILLITLVSLGVSCYIYDFSGLYKFEWMDKVTLEKRAKIVNIHAGFDETSALLQQHFPHCELTVLDFYDPEKHTEVSIKRARKAYPPYPNTKPTATTALPLKDKDADLIFLIFAAHEIRDFNERALFFKELRRSLSPNGKVVITEHLRDVPNFMAYTLGFFHFYSKPSWMKLFKTSGFRVSSEFKCTPFISTFILESNGTSS